MTTSRKVLVLAAVFAVLAIGVKFAISPSATQEQNSAHQGGLSAPASSDSDEPAIQSAATTVTSNDPVVQEQLKILTEILATKNDYDPRMDRDLKVLSEASKEKFREFYRTLAPEKLNDKGTLVFLLGRNIASESDLNFFKEVLNEAPCKSLGDCSKEAPATIHREDEEHHGGMAVSLAYPQLVALHVLDVYLKGHPKSALMNSIKNIFAQAKHAVTPEVAKMAESLLLQHSSAPLIGN